MIDKTPILAIPPKAFGDKHFAAEFNKFRMFMLSLADESNTRTLGYKGYLKISDPKPTEAGLYRLIEIGTYSNLTPAVDNNGNPTTIVSLNGKLNEAYYDGTKFVKSQVDLPGVNVALEFDPLNDVDAQAGKQIAGYVNAKSSKNYRITIEGQSNALGVGYSTGLLVSPYNTGEINWLGEFERVYIWNPKTDNYEKLKVGVNNMSAWDADYLNPALPTPVPQPTFGPELGVALSFIKTRFQGNLFIDKNVGDGQPISYFQKGGAYYTEKLDRKDKADQWLFARGISVLELGFVWVQGENDLGATSAYYLGQLNTLVNDRYSDGFFSAESKLIMTQIPSSSARYGPGVYQAKQQFVATNKYSKEIVYPSLYNSDNIHLNTTGQINLGVDCGSELFQTGQITFTDLLLSYKVNSIIDFQQKDFSTTIDLSRQNYSKYTQISGLNTFSVAPGSKFGVVAEVKLTGGTVVFPSNFVAQSGSATYDPSKTNVITFWKEYNKVRYFIEVFNLEPVLIDGVLSYYNFNGKPANTLLSAITPDTGISIAGAQGDYRINSGGTYLERITSVSSNSNAIGINTTGLDNYKIQIYMSSAGASYFSFGSISITDYTYHIAILPTQNKILAVSPSHPTGEIISTPSGIPTTTISLWEFRKIDDIVEIYINGLYRGTYTNPNTSNFFTFLQGTVNDKIQSFKIEEL